MARLNILRVLSLALLPSVLALPPFWPQHYSEAPYPTLTLSSSAGIYPIAGATGTGTGIGTASYPTGTGYNIKRDPDHPFGFPPPYQSSAIIMPTGTSSPYIPTGSGVGTAPSASGTGMPYPSYTPNKRDVEAAAQAHRQHFEGPRKPYMRPYYPSAPPGGYEGAAPRGTGSPFATGSGGVPYPVPTGTSVVPLPMPTGASSSAIVYPIPSGTGFPNT